MGGAWGRPTGTPDQHPRAQLPVLPRSPGTLIRWRTELGLWRQRSGAGSTLDDVKERGHPAIPTCLGYNGNVVIALSLPTNSYHHSNFLLHPHPINTLQQLKD